MIAATVNAEIPPPPSAIAPNFDGSHPDLERQENWCFWAHTLRTDGKYAKVPYRLNGSMSEASADDPATFGKFSDAKRLFKIWGIPTGRTIGRYHGVGFRLGNGFIGIDLDHSIRADGSIEPWARKVIDEFPGMNWEVSPSETGLKGIGRGSFDYGGKTGCKAYKLDGEPLPNKGAIELYFERRYFTITGVSHPSIAATAELQDCTPKVESFLARIGKTKGMEETESANIASDLATAATAVFEIRSDDDILQRLRYASNWPKAERLLAGDFSGYPSQSEADEALLCIFAFYTQDEKQLEELFARSGLNRDKWQERPDYRAETIKKAIELTKETYDWKRAAKQRKKKESVGPRKKADKTKPDIEITTDEHRVNDEAVAALAKRGRIYQRGGLLVEVIKSDDAARGVESSAASLRIAKISEARLRELISDSADFYTVSGKDTPDETEAPAHVPAWCVKAVAARGQWLGIPEIHGVVDTPVFRRDGTIADQSGFDLSTGLLLAFSREWPKVKDNPTLEDAAAARDLLVSMIVDFPLSEEHQRPAWLSMMLTPFARQAIDGPVPAVIIDGSTQGVGKGLLADTIGITATGEPIDRMSSPTTDEEMRKRITSIAIAGPQFVLQDNHTGKFGWPSWDAVITSKTWSDRLLGGNETFNGRISTIWLATGNNITMTPDALRRSVYIRMDAKDQRPEERTGFVFPDLRAELRRRRPELVHACLTILRCYHVHGRPIFIENSLGSFEEWSDLIRQAVFGVTNCDCLESRRSLRETIDTETVLLGNLLECWEVAFPDGCLAADALHAVVPHEVLGVDQRSPELRALGDAILAFCPGRDDRLPTARSLGARLKVVRKRIVNDRAFECHTERLGQRWRVFKLSN